MEGLRSWAEQPARSCRTPPHSDHTIGRVGNARRLTIYIYIERERESRMCMHACEHTYFVCVDIQYTCKEGKYGPYPFSMSRMIPGELAPRLRGPPGTPALPATYGHGRGGQPAASAAAGAAAQGLRASAAVSAGGGGSLSLTLSLQIDFLYE